MSAPIIYNLFPRLVGHMGRWSAHAGRAREMGFNWLFLNPIQYPGFSGSLYAVKDFYRLNPLFVPPGVADGIAELRRTLDALHHQGLQVMMDLVVNHTAKDSELTRAHPAWYKHDEEGEVRSPFAIDPADSRRVTVWGDLAEIDNEDSPDRDALWRYWTEVLTFYLELGFDGFRCDAAYKVPAALWELLIGTARRVRPDVVFAAETLGCRPREVLRLKGGGFDYLFNSSKWWAFDAPWALEQHEEYQQIAPSIAFPESHDTPRLMEETGGLVPVQKQRYLLAAFFSAGLLMPIGYEFGFRKRMNVVRTLPEDWEETGLDLSPFVREVNRLKSTMPIFGVEGELAAVTPLDGPTTVLSKRSAGLEPALLLVNKDWFKPQDIELEPLIPALDPEWSGVVGQEGSPRTPRSGAGERARPAASGKRARLLRPFRDGAAEPLPRGRLTLEPAEIALWLP